jgi:hypothetical protein
METLYATEAVLGKDRHCARYNRAFRAGKIGTKPEEKKAAPSEPVLATADERRP